MFIKRALWLLSRDRTGQKRGCGRLVSIWVSWQLGEMVAWTDEGGRRLTNGEKELDSVCFRES